MVVQETVRFVAKHYEGGVNICLTGRTRTDGCEIAVAGAEAANVQSDAYLNGQSSGYEATRDKEKHNKSELRGYQVQVHLPLRA